MTRARFSTQVDADLQDRVRATVRGLRHHGIDLTLAQVVEDALTRHCNWLEDTYNDGRPFTETPTQLTPGRRLANPQNPNIPPE